MNIYQKMRAYHGEDHDDPSYGGKEMDLSISLKEIRRLNIETLKKAKDFYERIFETSGGCDHSVGICECADRMDYERLCSMIDVLEGRLVI